MAGGEWFSVGAGLGAIIKQKLKFSDEFPGPKFPRYTDELRRHWFSSILASCETFEHWHGTELAEVKASFDPAGRLAKDQAVCARELSYAQLLERFPNLLDRVSGLGGNEQDLQAHYKDLTEQLATPTSAQAFIAKEIAKIPRELATNWVVEMLVKDGELRERVAREPDRCPTLVAEAGAVSLIRIGAAAGVEKDWKPYGFLTPSKNDWADAFIIAQAAYAHALVSKDKGLRPRAELLKELKLLRPDVMSWDQLLARQVV